MLRESLDDLAVLDMDPSLVRPSLDTVLELQVWITLGSPVDGVDVVLVNKKLLVFFSFNELSDLHFTGWVPQRWRKREGRNVEKGQKATLPFFLES